MKRKNIARIIIGTLFILFIGLYFTQTTGYYEFEQKKITSLTEEQIKQFEQDVKDGKNIDIKNYVDYGKKNYNNKISNASLSLSRKIEDTVTKGIEYLFNAVGKAMEE